MRKLIMKFKETELYKVKEGFIISLAGKEIKINDFAFHTLARSMTRVSEHYQKMEEKKK